jgi:hypothetical protein
MADDNKDLADLSAVLGQAIKIGQRLAQSGDQQTRWVGSSNLRTTMEMAAVKARVDILLEMRKSSNAAPAEPAQAKK